MSNDNSAPLVTAIRETMDMLVHISAGGIGEGGPTIEELDAHVQATGRPFDDNSDYHTAQWAWRRLERGLESAEEAM